jgi:hypothetical protein
LATAQDSDKLKSIELLVRIDPLGDQKVSLWLNGNDLGDAERRGDWLATSPPVTAVKRGLNRLSLVVGDVDNSAADLLSVADVQLWVRYNK